MISYLCSQYIQLSISSISHAVPESLTLGTPGNNLGGFAIPQILPPRPMVFQAPSLYENKSHLIPGMGAESMEILVELPNLIALQRFAIPKEVCLAGLLHSNKAWNPIKQSATRLMIQGFWDPQLKSRAKRWTILTLTPQDFMPTLSQILLNRNPTDLKMLQRKHSRLNKVLFFWPHCFVCLSLNIHPHSAASCLSTSLSAPQSPMLNRRVKDINPCKQEKKISNK